MDMLWKSNCNRMRASQLHESPHDDRFIFWHQFEILTPSRFDFLGQGLAFDVSK